MPLPRAFHCQRLLDEGRIACDSEIARREVLHPTTANEPLLPTVVRGQLAGKPPRTLGKRPNGEKREWEGGSGAGVAQLLGRRAAHHPAEARLRARVWKKDSGKKCGQEDVAKKKARRVPGFWIGGGEDEDRTHDLRIANGI